MKRDTKTHYLVVRVVFDKPCDKATAVKAVRYGLTRDKAIPARKFHTPYYFTQPTTFSVKRVIPK